MVFADALSTWFRPHYGVTPRKFRRAPDGALLNRSRNAVCSAVRGTLLEAEGVQLLARGGEGVCLAEEQSWI